MITQYLNPNTNAPLGEGKLWRQLEGQDIISAGYTMASAAGFGRGLMRNASDKSKLELFGSASGEFMGVSVSSTDVSTDGQYSSGEPAGAVLYGCPAVSLCEAVSKGDTVRMRHTGATTAGYQDWGFDTAKTGASATGLANDTTTYGCLVTVDGVINEVSIVGSDAQTITNLVSQINADLTGATASFEDDDDLIRITSDSTGASSSISIQDGNDSTDEDLFGTLTDANATVETAVAGTSATSQLGQFCTTAVAGETVQVVGAKFESAGSNGGTANLYLPPNVTITADV